MKNRVKGLAVQFAWKSSLSGCGLMVETVQ